MLRQWKVLNSMLLLVLGMSTFAQVQASVSKEEIIFLREDGRSYINYTSLRSNRTHYSVWFGKESTLENYLYINPNNFKWDNHSKDQFNILKFYRGSYALMNMGKLANNLLSVSSAGVFRYTNWDGRTKTNDGHYGIWNSPRGLGSLAVTWVLPSNFEIVGYSANRKGKWVKRGNTISFFAKNVNDLVYNIEYRPRGYSIYKAFNRAFGGRRNVGVVLDGKRVKLMLSETVLFPSGSANLSPGGKQVLSNISHLLQEHPENKVVVEGHTDDNPIRGKLKMKFKNNWSLSSARSLAVVNFILKKGVNGNRLESRSYGPYRPLASNATTEGRARNRRIELVLEAQ